MCLSKGGQCAISVTGCPQLAIRGLPKIISRESSAVNGCFALLGDYSEGVFREFGAVFDGTPAIGCSTASETMSVEYSRERVIAFVLSRRGFEVGEARSLDDNDDFIFFEQSDCPDERVAARTEDPKHASRERGCTPGDFTIVNGSIDGSSRVNRELIGAIGRENCVAVTGMSSMAGVLLKGGARGC